MRPLHSAMQTSHHRLKLVFQTPQDMSMINDVHLTVIVRLLHACGAVRSAGSAADLPAKLAAVAVPPANRCLAELIRTG